jgi:hypothetical protein
MVDLQEDTGPLAMKSRMKVRLDLEFNSERQLKFEHRSVKALADREFYFESFRRLHYDIIVEGTADRQKRAKDLNVQGVKLYKERKYHEAKWYFEKALSFDPGYENAKRNLRTINKKIKEMSKKKRREARKGKKLSAITKEWKEEKASSGYQSGYDQSQAQYAQQQQVSTGSYWTRNYRCQGCGIPVRTEWAACHNCGTDLRRYPPIPY